MSIKKVYKLLSVDNVKYETKEGTEDRKVVNLSRYERDAFGNVVAATIQNAARGSFFPKKYNRAGDIVDNTIYVNLQDTIGKQLLVTDKRFTTSPFNFPADGDDAEPRTSLNVMVPYGGHEDESVINERLRKQAQYQLRGMGVSIFEDGIEFKSTTETEQKARVTAAQEKAAALKADTGAETKTLTAAEIKAAKKSGVNAAK